MNILHVAPINVAGVPYSMMDLHRHYGHHARLVTLHMNRYGFPEDICLNFPLPQSPLAHLWRDYKRSTQKVALRISGEQPDTFLPIYRPHNAAERLYFWLTDMRRRPRIEQAVKEYQLDQFEIIHYDGGVDLYRDARLAKRWKKEGKKIVCHYMGSDLRIRGIHPVLNELSDLNLTNESDHLLRHPDIHYIFIPFDTTGLTPREHENERLRIIHSPTNRAMKGTELILPVIERVNKERDIEFVLVENTPHDRVLEIKRTCDLAIEQVGNYGGTGYGRNSLENLALGIPTITEMTPDYISWLPEHPFVLATAETLFDRLIELIDDASFRRRKANEGRRWVEKYHSYESVYTRLIELYRDHGIIEDITS